MSTHDLELEAHGRPIPLGSKRGFYNKGLERIVVVDDNEKELKAWRATIVTAAYNAIAAQDYTPADGPLRADLTFYFDRPAYHFGTGRNARRLKPDAPAYVAVKPDIDKLVRAVLDALTDAAVLPDDARVVKLDVAQLYIRPGQQAGVLARIRPMTTNYVEVRTVSGDVQQFPTGPEQPPALFD